MSARRRDTAEEEKNEVVSEEKEKETEEEQAEEKEEERRSVDDEDFEEVMKEAASSAVSRRKLPEQQVIFNIPEAVEDFLRNFLRKAGLSRTLSSFEAEWYGSAQRLLQETLPTAAAAAPDIFLISDARTHRQLLELELDSVRRDTELLKKEAMAAAESLMRTRRERDFHRLQYGRVAEQKNRLVDDLKQLKKHLESYEPVLRHVEDKYQTALRQKTLINLHKDRLQNSTKRSQEKAKEKKENCQKKKKN